MGRFSSQKYGVQPLQYECLYVLQAAMRRPILNGKCPRRTSFVVLLEIAVRPLSAVNVVPAVCNDQLRAPYRLIRQFDGVHSEWLILTRCVGDPGNVAVRLVTSKPPNERAGA